VYREFAARGKALTVAKLSLALGGGNKQRITAILRQVKAEAEAKADEDGGLDGEAVSR
jgi:hypothetical protein